MSSSQDLCDLIGDEAFDRVCIAYGGMRLMFGSSMRERLDIVIGAEAADKVIKVFDGERVEIPTESPYRKRAREAALRKQVSKQAASGLTDTEIALANGMTPRWVRKLLNGRP